MDIEKFMSLMFEIGDSKRRNDVENEKLLTQAKQLCSRFLHSAGKKVETSTKKIENEKPQKTWRGVPIEPRLIPLLKNNPMPLTAMIPKLHVSHGRLMKTLLEMEQAGKLRRVKVAQERKNGPTVKISMWALPIRAVSSGAAKAAAGAA
jgi:predicted Rossmann fold nucleotide-binding protein DprA/Smf involved in DNA uptake